MKNKKLLLVATAAMGVLALGTAGVGTAAWFKVGSTTAAASHTNKTFTVASTSYNAGDVTFSIVASTDVNYSDIVLTDDYGLTYYTSGSTHILDCSLLGAGFAKGTQYGQLTLTLSASVATGHISDALNALAGGNFHVTFAASGTGSAALKYKTGDAPTQAATADSNPGAYTEESNTSTGSSKWINKAATTWANGTGPTADQTFSLAASYDLDTNTSKTLQTLTYWFGLSGTTSDQSSFRGQTIEFEVGLDDGTIVFGS